MCSGEGLLCAVVRGYYVQWSGATMCSGEGLCAVVRGYYVQW